MEKIDHQLERSSFQQLRKKRSERHTKRHICVFSCVFQSFSYLITDIIFIYSIVVRFENIILYKFYNGL